MHIALDIRLLSRGDLTGIPGYTRNLVNHLLAQPTHNQYSLFYNAFRKQPLPDAWTAHTNVAVIGGRLPNRLLNLSFGFLNGPVPRALKNADVVWSPNLDILPRTRTPRVITFHDASFIRYPDFFSIKDHLWHRLQFYARQAREAARIIAVSEFTKADLVTLLRLPPEKIDVVYSGIDPSFAPLPAHDTRLAAYRHEKNLTRPFFLYLGSLEPRKNIPLLIRAFTELKPDPRFKEYQLVLAGRLGYRANEVTAAAKNSRASSDIIFLGSVPDAERVLLYNAARAFVFPSWLEGFGFPPLEAQACGTPVVAANRASLPEILGSSALLIDPWQSGELADALRHLETNAATREEIISRGIHNAGRFTWQDTAARTLETLKRVAHIS